MKIDLKYVTRFLQGCSLLAVLNTLLFMNDQTAWSPIDEYAHMDYIEKLAEGRLPKISDTLSDEIMHDIQFNFFRSVSKTFQTKNELGLAQYSYQAKHPPVYYVVLLLPNCALKFFHQPVFSRVQVLRIISYAMYVAGTLMLLLVFRQLRRKYESIPLYFPWLVILCSLIIFPHERYGLGNNAMSPLMVNSSLLALTCFMNTGRHQYLRYVTLFASLSCCVALSNILIIPFILLIVLYFLFNHFDFKQLLLHALMMMPAIIIFTWWKHNSVPEPVIGMMIEQLLKTFIPASMVSYPVCLKLLWQDLFTIQLLHASFYIGLVMLVLFVLSLLSIMFHIRTTIRLHFWLVLCIAMMMIFLAEIYVLNKYVHSVTWVAYRHYLGFTGFLFTTIFSGLLLFAKPRNSYQNYVHPDSGLDYNKDHGQ